MTIETPAVTAGRPPAGASQPGRVKCVVWDLDNTVWDGTLLEGDETVPNPGVLAAIRQLDGRGILHSIASRNDPDAAMARLRELGIEEYFLHPQIGWHSKSESVRQIAAALNIGLDALAFVDDQDFERAEVAFAVPEVLCVDPAHLDEVLRGPAFHPRFVTEDSRRRRQMYRSQIQREETERAFVGTNEDFLASLDMTFTIATARRADLQRAEELTVRTNQLNSTGVTYSYEQLDRLRSSPDHLLLVASLEDRFGSYGTVGVTLVERGEQIWHLRLLLMSCRVMSRGVGTVLLNHVMRLARDAGARLRADFVDTGRNRLMQITYAFAGFREVSRDGTRCVLENDLTEIQSPAPYLRLRVH